MPWWQLKATADAQRAWQRIYYAEPPTACPRDGTPLDVGSESQPGGGKLAMRHCIMCGYSWQGGTRLT